MKPKSIAITVMAVLAAAAALTAAEIPDNVKELFQKRCTGCHKGPSPPKGLNLEPERVDAILDAPSKEVPALKIVNSESPASSYLLKKVRRGPGIAGSGMPPRKPLTPEELRIIEAWLAGPGGRLPD